MKTIKNLGTDKHRVFLERAAAFEEIGAFTMTELSHGSDVQSIKTSATYDPKTKEFIMHTPTAADMKFWIGSLAKTATMAVVFAQLYTGGKKQGVHAFVIQVKDKKTMEPLPGVTIGDCGLKIGLVRMKI